MAMGRATRGASDQVGGSLQALEGLSYERRAILTSLRLSKLENRLSRPLAGLTDTKL